MANNWIKTADRLPEKGVEVNTKIDDARGERNVQTLVLGGTSGRLWFYPDYSMYVYYSPTHWAEIEPKASNHETSR